MTVAVALVCALGLFSLVSVDATCEHEHTQFVQADCPPSMSPIDATHGDFGGECHGSATCNCTCTCQQSADLAQSPLIPVSGWVIAWRLVPLVSDLAEGAVHEIDLPPVIA